MPEKLPPRPPSAGTVRPAKKADRVRREAAALRANLRKRKDQVRERAQERQPPRQD